MQGSYEQKILVADDSPTIRKVAESLLKKQGYEVFCAEDGASALGMAKTNKPDLIFWDDSLPILNGHGVCEELKGNKELKDTPLIILLTKDEVKKEEKLARPEEKAEDSQEKSNQAGEETERQEIRDRRSEERAARQAD